MFAIETRNNFFLFQAFVFSALVVFILFWWQGNIVSSVNGFLQDEGFLWYGAQRVMLGEVPIRDFMSYDPGRYYWSAAFMSLWGDNGIMALRGAVAIFQTIGLFAGLLLISRAAKKQNLFYLLLSATVLVTWMIQHFRAFDISLSIFLIGILSFLVQNPTTNRYFLAGIGVGLVAVFARNYGVYGIAGSIGIMAWLNIRREKGPGLIKGFSFWSAGVTVGFMPILFMLLLVPGFALAFWEGIKFVFEFKATNIFIPIPWPWRVDFATVSLVNGIRGILVGLFIMALVIFSVLSVAWVVLEKFRNRQVSSVLVAASFLGLPYVHRILSRADISSLPMGIFLLLISCLFILATQPTKVKWTLTLILCAASIFTTWKLYPAYNCRAIKQCVNIEISGSDMVVSPYIASEIRLLRRLADQYAPDGQSFIAMPFWPGAYALLERKSPTWETYALFPRSQSFEQNEIDRIKVSDPGFIFVLDLPLDGRNDLRFKNTHPLTHQYILDHFERISASPNPAYQIYRAKESE